MDLSSLYLSVNHSATTNVNNSLAVASQNVNIWCLNIFGSKTKKEMNLDMLTHAVETHNEYFFNLRLSDINCKILAQ